MIALHDAATGRWLRFAAPRAVVTAARTEEVREALDELSRRVERDRLVAAGFVSYEAAPAFDPACATHPPGDFPLLWFGLFDRAEELLAPPGGGAGRPGDAPRDSDAAPDAARLAWRPDLDFESYAARIARVRAAIAAGETYQVNLTYRLRAPFAGDPWPLFRRLHAAQGGAYAAYADIGRFAVLSLSPELFFTLDGDRLVCRPMKGTAARGRWPEEDAERAAALCASAKERAENVMIVDMVRNDLGRVAETGSVAVPRLFDAERFPTLWQLTSTVTARSRAPFGDLLAALFPCASVTGAPRIATMRLIAELEDHPRRAYTGCVGYLAPDRRAQFNVAIRTVLVDRLRGEAEYGVGGGVVWDSTAAAEWRECRTKALVLAGPPEAFSLLETMRLGPGGEFALLEAHLARLAASAAYFGFRYDGEAARAALAAHAAAHRGETRRVRALLAPGGEFAVESEPLAVRDRPLALAVSPLRVRSSDPMLQHKTTRRELYRRALAACPGAEEALLLNERGELTEACSANVVLELDGEKVTPARDAGLLAGTFRQELLARGELRESPLVEADLLRASRIWLVNSVRGWMEAALAPHAVSLPGSD